MESTDWNNFLPSASNIIEQVDTVSSHITFFVDNIIPTKEVTIFPNNKPWITKELKEILNKRTFFTGTESEKKGINREVKSAMKMPSSRIRIRWRKNSLKGASTQLQHHPTSPSKSSRFWELCADSYRTRHTPCSQYLSGSPQDVETAQTAGHWGEEPPLFRGLFNSSTHCHLFPPASRHTHTISQYISHTAWWTTSCGDRQFTDFMLLSRYINLMTSFCSLCICCITNSYFTQYILLNWCICSQMLDALFYFIYSDFII